MKRVSGMANIDANGIITITGNSTKIDEITITIKTNAKQTITKKCNLICSWVAPAVGDFAYADGSFSTAYNPSKTLIGLVYDKKVATGQGTDAETGTVYIIGKEYALEDLNGEGLYTGINYTGASNSSPRPNPKDISVLRYALENYLKLINYN
jgi:hypothetical protein